MKKEAQINKIIEQEGKNLESFLKKRNLNSNDLPKLMGEHYNTFLIELNMMNQLIREALIVAEKTGNMREVVHIMGAKAKVQKDNVYLTMFKIWDPLKGFIVGGYAESIRDYVMGTYENGVRQLEKIFGEI